MTIKSRSVMFTVESVDDTVARLRARGAELVGEVARYEDRYRLDSVILLYPDIQKDKIMDWRPDLFGQPTPAINFRQRQRRHATRP